MTNVFPMAPETDVVFPLGGSFHVEGLTNELERQAYSYFDQIEQLGGVVQAIKENFFQKEIAEASFRYQAEVEAGERVVVGVNRYVQADEKPIPYLKLDEGLEREQIERVRAVKAGRSAVEVERHLRRVADACRSGQNLMPALVDAVKAHVSLGEIADVYRQVFGRYREPIIF